MKRYMLTYDHDGATCGFDIQAANRADADRQLRAIKMTARVEGHVIVRLPGWLARLPIIGPAIVGIVIAGDRDGNY